METIQGDSGGPVIESCGCGGFWAEGMITNTASQNVPVGNIESLGFSVKTQ